MDDVVNQHSACLSLSVAHASKIRIGCDFVANPYSYIEHHFVIGNFFAFGPTNKMIRNVTVRDHGYIGSDAVIRPGISVEDYAIVGIGDIVTRDLPCLKLSLETQQTP